MRGPILLVFAHPDDESSSCAGTTARYTRKGVFIDLVCATGGEKGTRLDVPADVDTATARAAEQRAAAGITGIRQIYRLGYIDGELDKADPDEVSGRVRDIMVEVKPEVVITFGPDGISGHPDHIAIGKAATSAFGALAESAGAPRKLYYVTIPASAFLSDNNEDAGVATRPDDEITTEIDISDLLDVKVRAIESYRSQEDARWIAGMFRQAGKSSWAGKEYFYLANLESAAKETDLFA